jgi:hypothetical protein
MSYYIRAILTQFDHSIAIVPLVLVIEMNFRDIRLSLVSLVSKAY